MRLAIVCALAAVREALTFKELKTRLGATDGNLGVHVRRLETADTSRARNRSPAASRGRNTG
ncbi:MAG TPA: transcriptional regulator [Vicinamibacterales bacterium]